MDDFKEYLQSRLKNDTESVGQIIQFGIRSLDELYTVIHDPDATIEVRKSACHVLGRLAIDGKKNGIDRRRALSALLAALNSPNDDLRREVLRTVGFVRNKRALQPLLRVAFNDPESSVRLDAIWALGILNDTRAVPELLRLAQDKKADRMERVFAIIALHDVHVVGDTNVLPHLQAIMLDPEEDAEVRAEAAEWLAHMVNNTDMIPSYIQLLQDEAVILRFWAAFGLVTMSWLDISEALPIIDRVVAHDKAVLPGWWSVSREAAPALEHLWYQRFSICTDESCCCRAPTYLISALWEYWDYREKSRVSGGDGTRFVPYEQQTNLNLEPGWLSKELCRQWPSVGVNVRQSKPEALLLDWQITMDNGLVLGGLHLDGQCIFLTGDRNDVATFALWYRKIIPQQYVLRLYGWADPGREVVAGMSPEQLVSALDDYSAHAG